MIDWGFDFDIYMATSVSFLHVAFEKIHNKIIFAATIQVNSPGSAGGRVSFAQWSFPTIEDVLWAIDI